MNNKISQAASVLGHRGGQSTSEAKQAASRENGKLGGRPRKSKKEIAAMSDTDIMEQFRRYTNGDNYISIGVVEKKFVEKRVETVDQRQCTLYYVIVTCNGKDYPVTNWLVTERQLDSDCQKFAKHMAARISIGERVVLNANGQATVLDENILWPQS